MATVRPRASRSSAPQATTSKPAFAKAIAAASPASPAPATRTSQTRSMGSARRVMGVKLVFSCSGADARPRGGTHGETAPPDFDKAKAPRSSHGRDSGA